MAFSASLTLEIIRNYKLRCGWSISKWTSTKTRRLDGFPLGGRGCVKILAEFHRIRHKNVHILGKNNGCRSGKLQGCIRSHFEVWHVREN